MDKNEAQYLDLLLKQFSKAVDISDFTDPDSFFNNFQLWLQKMDKISEEYAKLLDNNGIDFMDSNVAEVGKSGYDSVVRQYDTTIITEVPKTFKNVQEDRIIEGRIEVERDGLYIKNGKKRLKKDWIDTVMTQNPYDFRKENRYQSRTLERLAFLHERELNKIIIGFYGSLKDKDRKEKIAKLKLLKQNLEDISCIEREDSENFYYVVITDTTAKNKVKLFENSMSYYPFNGKPAAIRLDTPKVSEHSVGVRIKNQ